MPFALPDGGFDAGAFDASALANFDAGALANFDASALAGLTNVRICVAPPDAGGGSGGDDGSTGTPDTGTPTPEASTPAPEAGPDGAAEASP
jgi:hypothetical protein